MGYIGSNALNALPNKTIDSKRAIVFLKECETYIRVKVMAKISRILMPRASRILEKVHSNICGPISPKTFSKNRYFISFINDKIRYASIRLLRTKNQLYNEFNS